MALDLGLGLGFHYACSFIKLNLTCLPYSSPGCSSSLCWRGDFNVLSVSGLRDAWVLICHLHT